MGDRQFEAEPAPERAGTDGKFIPRALHALYRQLFDHMSSGVAIYAAVENGADFVFVDFNRAAERIDRIGRADLIGRRLTDVFPGVRDFGLFDVFQRVWRTGVPEEFPVRFYQDGRIAGWRQNYVYRLPSGELVAIYEDITGQKQAEERLRRGRDDLERQVEARTRQLRESEAWLRDIVETTYDRLWEMDETLRFLAIWDRPGSIRQPQPDAAIGKTRWGLTGADPDTDETWRRHRDDLLARRPYRNFEHATTDAKGETTYWSTSGKPIFDEDGKFRGYRGSAIDITERKLAEARLAQNQARLANAQRIANLGHWDWDMRSDEVDCSEQARRIFGLEPGRSAASYPALLERVHAEDRALVEAAVRRAIEARAPWKVDHRIVLPSGEVRIVRDQGEIELDAAGEPAHMTGTVLDITDLRRAETALGESEQRYRTLVEAAPSCIHEVDGDGRLMSINPAGVGMLGVRRAADLEGLDYVCLAEAEDRPSVKGMLDRALAGAPGSFQFRADRRYGRRILAANLVPIRDFKGRVAKVMGIIRDVTEERRREDEIRALNEQLESRVEARTAELRESEERFRQIAENIRDVFWICSPDWQIIDYVSPAFEEVWQRRCRELCEHPGVWVDAIHPDDRAAVVAEMERKAGGDLSNPYSPEFRVVRPDGSIRWVLGRTYPVRDGSGAIVRFVGVSEDITERKRLEDALLRKARLAALGRLTGTVAHEIRNPLGALANSLSLIKYRTANAGLGIETALDRAERSIKRCDNIITELLDFARAKGLKPVPTILDVWLADILAEQNIPASVAVAWQRAANGIVVAFDREALRRAIINVVVNAIQAMGDPAAEADDGRIRGRLTIATRAVGGRVEIEVADTGPGIPPAVLPRVLEPLFSTKPFGTGLGLPTVQRIMEDHGGGLEIGNREDGGARVVLWLPLERAGAGAPP